MRSKSGHPHSGLMRDHCRMSFGDRASWGRQVPAALLILWTAGCATSQAKRTVYHYQPDYGVADEQFERTLVALGGGLLPGNRALLLNNGDAFFPAILEAIRGAQRSVN